MSQDPFDQKKAQILKEINETLGLVPDASPKGSIDELCIPIMHLINSHRDMVTTSSCSGRVSVFLEGSKVKENNVKIGGKGDGGRWLFVTHDDGDDKLDNWYKSQPFQYVTPGGYSEDTRYILYKFEALILHVKCRDFKTASRLYQTAMNCGFRESGIGTNNIVAIRISIKLDIPIGYLDGEDLKCFVTEDYLELITQLSHDRFKENGKRLKLLYREIDVLINAKDEDKEQKEETKEQRRERKKREGLEKQRERQRLKELNIEKELKDLELQATEDGI